MSWRGWLLPVLVALALLRMLPAIYSVRLVTWLHVIDFDTRREDEILLLRAGGDPDLLLHQDVAVCSRLWQSRLALGRGGEQAQTLLNQAAECKRHDLWLRWAGQLAWARQGAEAASPWWAQLAPRQLLRLGRQSALSGDTSRALLFLQLAIPQAEHSLNPSDSTLLYTTLAGLYEDQGQMELALQYRRQAWVVSGHGYEAAFYLGRAYHGLGDCIGAVDIMEKGLTYKPPDPHPQLDFSYVLELGECYAQLGRTEQAWKMYDLARALFDEMHSRASQADLEPLALRLRNFQTALEQK